MDISFGALLLVFLGIMVLAYVGLSYEDEEAGLIAWLESTWISLHSGEKLLGARLNEFAVLASASTRGLLALVYGRTTFSLQTVLRAGCLVNGFTLGGLAMLTNIYATPPHWLAIAGVASVLLSFVPWNTVTAAVLVLSTMFAFESLVFHISSYLQFPVTPTMKISSVILVSAYIVEVGSLFAIVAFLRRVDQGNRLLCNGVWILLAAVAVPALLEFNVLLFPHITEFGVDSTQALYPLFATLNSVAFLTSSALLAVLVISIVVRLAGFILPRAIYSTIKLKVMANRKALAGAGFFLLGAGLLGDASKVSEVAKAFF